MSLRLVGGSFLGVLVNLKGVFVLKGSHVVELCS